MKWIKGDRPSSVFAIAVLKRGEVCPRRPMPTEAYARRVPHVTEKGYMLFHPEFLSILQNVLTDNVFELLRSFHGDRRS